MKIIKNLILLVLGFLLVACHSTNVYFPKEERLTPELMPLHGMTFPVRVEIKNPYMIVQNMKMRDSLFHIYDLRTYTFQTAFGKIGEGQNNFIAPWLMHVPFSDMLLADIAKNRLYRYTIQSGDVMLKSDESLLTKKGINGAAFINDSLFVIDAKYYADPHLYVYNLHKKEPVYSLEYGDSHMFIRQVDTGYGNVYVNSERIFFCYGYKKQIDFMDTNFKLIKRLEFDYTEPTVSISPDSQGDEKVSYVYCYAGRKYLYALFLGMSWNAYREQETCGTILEVFDMDGNPIIRYKLQGRRPMYFAVDEESFTIYGPGEDGDPEDNLLVYKLKGLS